MPSSLVPPAQPKGAVAPEMAAVPWACPTWLSLKEANRQMKGIYPPVPRDFVPGATTAYDPRMHCGED